MDSHDNKYDEKAPCKQAPEFKSGADKAAPSTTRKLSGKALKRRRKKCLQELSDISEQAKGGYV